MQRPQKQNLNKPFRHNLIDEMAATGRHFCIQATNDKFPYKENCTNCVNLIFLFSCYHRSSNGIRRCTLFTFDPINRRQYRYAMLIATVMLVVITSNFQSFMEIITGSINCAGVSSLCISLTSDVPDYVILTTTILFFIITAIATLRRISATPISNYWVVILIILIFLDQQFLVGIGDLWDADFSISLDQMQVPWYLLSATSLVLLLSFSATHSSYFLDGYWNADPPLGYGLSISSFWLLAFSSSKIMLIIATATDNSNLWYSSHALRQQLESLLPALLISPVIPAVIFTTCSLLLIVLGRMGQEDATSTAKNAQQSTFRKQAALRTTKAAQSANGLKF